LLQFGVWLINGVTTVNLARLRVHAHKGMIYCTTIINLILKCAALKEGHYKKDARWQPRNCCDSRQMVKFLIMTIQVNLCCILHISLGFGIKFTWNVIIKIFTISLSSQPFLVCHLGFLQWSSSGLLVAIYASYTQYAIRNEI